MSTQKNQYNAFNGVFVPTIISILGVIMYLRQGWVVGNAGLMWAWVIIVFSIIIALATGISLSSIATNTRLHAGGAYAIISRSLGLEAGACIGVALYLAQSFAITMYLFGFREGWLAVFPNHDPLWVDTCSFLLTFGIAVWSTSLANRVQYVVLFITAVSLFCIASGDWRLQPHDIVWYGSFEATGGGYNGFWLTFAVFFPAVTGVMAGANMSGELANPRKSIPKGTIYAILISAVIYMWLAWVLAQMAPPKILIEQYDILVEKSQWGPLVQLAILCATSSSALVTMVGAPWILQALAQDGLLPKSSWINRCNDRGEPRNATILTGMLVFLALGFRDLNALAPVITICFLTTYASINGVVLIEQGIGLVSFRPRLRIPLWVPFVGAVGSFFAMIVINPSLSVLALALILLSYALMTKRGIDSKGDVRGNIFLALAQWVAREAIDLPRSQARAWIPHPMVVLYDGQKHPQTLELAFDLAHPRGSIKLLDIQTKGGSRVADDVRRELRERGVFCSGTQISSADRTQTLITALQVLQGAFFRPNILMLNLQDNHREDELHQLVYSAREAGVGLILSCDKHQHLHSGASINVWVRTQEPDWNISDAQREGNLDLALLLAIRLAKCHGLSICLLTLVYEPAHYSLAEHYLHEIIDLGRLPKTTSIRIFKGDFWSELERAPKAEVKIFGMPAQDDMWVSDQGMKC